MSPVMEPGLMDTRPMLASARLAQADWVRRSFLERKRCFRRLRGGLAANSVSLAQALAAVKDRPPAEKLASEVLPLADTCCWLEKRAEEVLRPRRQRGKDRPLWLQGVEFHVHRQPFGIILVIGPANYPLFIPGSQILHALAAGNAVLFKPAPGTELVAEIFARITGRAGFDARLFQLLPSNAESGIEAIRQGVDKIIFTGRSLSGRSVLAEAAAQNTPSVMELSGEDAAVILPDADLDLAIRCLRFAARWNQGDTCMAPQRIIVVESIASAFRKLSAAGDGPEIEIEVVADADSAIRAATASHYGLGISIFSRDPEKARLLAATLKTGFAVINDLIVPTADPRMPFGGIKGSGFGVSRGAEGLLEMTFPHVVLVRHGSFRPHLEPLSSAAESLFAAYTLAIHGEGRHRLRGIRAVLAALLAEKRSRREKN
jgi:acyl-CoA reductase-like NAD-dependent aldehyde dehydrogenase